MSEKRIAEAMRERALPGEHDAEERAWRVVSAAFDEARPAPRRHSRRRVALALAALLALGAMAFTPAGAKVGDWIEDTFSPGRDDAEPALVSLPTDGSLLVSSAEGQWVVQPDGSKRHLPGYAAAGWSPRGLYVVATRRHELLALEPDGDVRWRLGRSDVSHAAWSLHAPDTRIAYLSGDQLRLVAGDSTGDRALAARVAPVTPAWSPARVNTLAYADARGRVFIVDADSPRRRSRTPPGPVPSQLAWSADGERLVAVWAGGIRVFDSHGRPIATRTLPAGTRAGELAVHPSGRRAALVRVKPAARRSEVLGVSLDSGRFGRRPLFGGDGRFSDLAWSPDGRWLLIAWPDADQWLFVRSTRVPKVEAVSNITSQFGRPGATPAPFPRVDNWCCPP